MTSQRVVNIGHFSSSIDCNGFIKRNWTTSKLSRQQISRDTDKVKIDFPPSLAQNTLSEVKKWKKYLSPWKGIERYYFLLKCLILTNKWIQLDSTWMLAENQSEIITLIYRKCMLFTWDTTKYVQWEWLDTHFLK